MSKYTEWQNAVIRGDFVGSYEDYCEFMAEDEEVDYEGD